MLVPMRTTIRLDDALLERARREAQRRGVTVTALLEQGLRLVLATPLQRANRPVVRLPECDVGGGLRPGIDLDDTADLLDRFDATE